MLSNLRRVNSNFYARDADKNFCYYTRWMRWMLTCSGMLPIWRGKDDRMHFTWMNWRVFYSILFYVISIGIFTKFTLIDRCHQLLASKYDFDDFINNLMFLSFGKNQYFYSIAGWMSSRKIVRYYNMWTEIEKSYYVCFGKRLLMEKMEKKCNKLVCLCMLSVLMLVFGQLFFLSTYQFHECLGYIPSTVACFLFLSTMHLHCSSIELLAENVLASLKSALSRRVVTQDMIWMQRKLWLSMSNLTQELGNSFSYFSIIVILGSHIDLVISGYGYLSRLIRRLQLTNSNELVTAPELGLIIASLVSLLVIVHISNCCFNVTHKVQEPFVDELCMATTKNYHPKIVKELDIFLQTIQNNPPVISLSGYVIIDRKFITKIFSLIITYWIVLVQFKFGFDRFNLYK